MSYDITCNRCNSPIEHICDDEGGFKEALLDLLSWVPEDGISGENAPRDAILKGAVENGDDDLESMPFFGSQSWSYLFFHKYEARTFHGLLNWVIRQAGLNPYDLGREAWARYEAEKARSASSPVEVRRRVLGRICHHIRKCTGRSGTSQLLIEPLTKKVHKKRLSVLIKEAVELGCTLEVLDKVYAIAAGEVDGDIWINDVHAANHQNPDPADAEPERTAEELAADEAKRRLRFLSEIADVCDAHGYDAPTAAAEFADLMSK